MKTGSVKEVLLEKSKDVEPLVCTRCKTEIETVNEPWPEQCPNCNAWIDVNAQFAYSRGRDAFIAGQELLFGISPATRRKNLTTEDEMQGLQYYAQAFTAFQVAFQGALAESQRRLSIEIMSAIALVFQQHSSISPLEAAYWQALMMELSMQQECEIVRGKIGLSRPGILGFPIRWRWRQRLTQLEKALVEIDQKINRLERGIKFIERPKVRHKTLPPL